MVWADKSRLIQGFRGSGLRQSVSDGDWNASTHVYRENKSMNSTFHLLCQPSSRVLFDLLQTLVGTAGAEASGDLGISEPPYFFGRDNRPIRQDTSNSSCFCSEIRRLLVPGTARGAWRGRILALSIRPPFRFIITIPESLVFRRDAQGSTTLGVARQRGLRGSGAKG